MKLLRPAPTEGAAGLRALATVARSRWPMADPARRLLEAGQALLLGTAEPIDSLRPITPDELAEAVTRPEIREQLVSGMVMLSLSAGEPPPQPTLLVSPWHIAAAGFLRRSRETERRGRSAAAPGPTSPGSRLTAAPRPKSRTRRPTPSRSPRQQPFLRRALLVTPSARRVWAA